MPFIDIKSVKPLEVLPGCKMRTPFGENLMLSYLEMDEGAIVPQVADAVGSSMSW